MYFFFVFIREIALCGLAIFLCEELKHQRAESPIRPFIVFIVECLQVGWSYLNRRGVLNNNEMRKKEICIS